MDSMDGSNESELNIEDVAFPSDESLTLFLTSDALSDNRLYYKCKKVDAGSSASGSRHEATDSESDVSSYSCGDIFEVMDTKKNRDDRMLEIDIEINSQRTTSDSEDYDIYDSDGDVSLLKFNKIFNNPKRNDFELVNTFNLLEVSTLAV
jgi:hypothetical protein